jgi:hypothetical protein
MARPPRVSILLEVEFFGSVAPSLRVEASLHPTHRVP